MKIKKLKNGIFPSLKSKLLWKGLFFFFSWNFCEELFPIFFNVFLLKKLLRTKKPKRENQGILGKIKKKQIKGKKQKKGIFWTPKFQGMDTVLLLLLRAFFSFKLSCKFSKCTFFLHILKKSFPSKIWFKPLFFKKVVSLEITPFWTPFFLGNFRELVEVHIHINKGFLVRQIEKYPFLAKTLKKIRAFK